MNVWPLDERAPQQRDSGGVELVGRARFVAPEAHPEHLVEADALASPGLPEGCGRAGCVDLSWCEA